MALVPGRVMMAVATLLHPSRETATTIIASEVGLVAAHFVYTLASLLVLLGLPDLCVSPRRDGTAGIDRFLTAFAGTYLIAVTGNFGFFAPLLLRSRRPRLTLLVSTGLWLSSTGWLQSHS